MRYPEIVGEDKYINEQVKQFFIVPCSYHPVCRPCWRRADSSDLLDYVGLARYRRQRPYEQMALFENKKDAENFLDMNRIGKGRANAIGRAFIPRGVEIVEGTVHQWVGVKGSTPEILAQDEKYSEYQIPLPLKIINFKPGDRQLFIAAHIGEDEPHDSFSMMHGSYNGRNYNDIWNTKITEPWAVKIRRLYGNYAHPTCGWFLSFHWRRSKENMRFCDSILLPQLKEKKDDPLELANWLIEKIQNDAPSQEINPKGSFMRRTYYILDRLFEAAEEEKNYNERSKVRRYIPSSS